MTLCPLSGSQRWKREEVRFCPPPTSRTWSSRCRTVSWWRSGQSVSSSSTRSSPTSLLAPLPPPSHCHLFVDMCHLSYWIHASQWVVPSAQLACGLRVVLPSLVRIPEMIVVQVIYFLEKASKDWDQRPIIYPFINETMKNDDEVRAEASSRDDVRCLCADKSTCHRGAREGCE